MLLEEHQALEGHEDRVWSVSWSPSGELLASCSGDRTVRIWARDCGPSAVTSKWYCKSILEETQSRTVRSCDWSSDGRFLATASFGGTAAIWEYSGGEFECLATLEGHESEVKSVAWNADGTLLATCSRDKSVWVWDVSVDPRGGGGAGSAPDYDCLAVLHGHTQDVKMVRWHPHRNWLVSASYDDTIKVWAEEDPSGCDWSCVQTLGGPTSAWGHSSTVWSVSFDASGNHMVSSSDDLTLKLWDTSREPGEPGNAASSLDQTQGWRHLCTASGHHGRTVFSADWSRVSGLVASGSGDDAIRIFRPHFACATVAAPGSPCAASMAPDAPAGMAVNGHDSSPAAPEAASLELISQKPQAHSTDVNCVRWHPQDASLLASAGDDERVKIWRVRSCS